MDFLAGEKRPGDDGLGLDSREVKRVKGDVKKVAEMVLVLSAMGKIRGGRLPSEAERDLMAQAREKLVEVCQEFDPRDVFPAHGVASVIQDLGLADSKDQRLGFRPPKMSISDKLSLSKRKFQLEKAEEFASTPPTSSQKFQGNAITALERRGLSQHAQVGLQNKSFHASIPSASPQHAATFGHVAATKSLPLPYQLPTSEVRSTVANAFPSSHLMKDPPTLPLAGIDGPSVKVDGRPTSSSHASQVQVQAMQQQPGSSTRMVSENRVPLQSVKGDGTVVIKSGITPQSATTKLVTTQVASGATPIHQTIPTVNVGQPPRVRSTHSEIANMVQKLLHRYVDHPVWTIPSRDYLNRPWPCQMCQSSVTDAESLLICDNCEKGYHLKCLQTANHKRAAKGEWHCFRCLSASPGKPLPPKYGRVMRNMNNSKIISNTPSVRPSSGRKTATVDEKPNLQKVSSNGNSSKQSAHAASVGCNSIQPILQSTVPNAVATQNNEIMPSKGEMDVKHSPGTCPNNSTGAHGVSSGQPDEEKRLVDLKSNSLGECEKALTMESHSQSDQQSKIKEGVQSGMEIPLDQHVDNHCIVTDSSEQCSSEAAAHSNKESELEDTSVLRVNLGETATTTSSNREASNSSSDHSAVVDWVGTMFEVVDEKVYYQSCCINGVVYEIQDYVLVRFEKEKLIPSKLQVMWEDLKTKSKWFTVNRCYFPGDLPEAVGRPCGLEKDEVYESTRGSTIMAALIQGPCDVLPQNKFEAEKERRASSVIDGSVDLRPYYLCKWIYDEAKGLFRDLSY